MAIGVSSSVRFVNEVAANASSAMLVTAISDTVAGAVATTSRQGQTVGTYPLEQLYAVAAPSGSVPAVTSYTASSFEVGDQVRFNTAFLAAEGARYGIEQANANCVMTISAIVDEDVTVLRQNVEFATYPAYFLRPAS